MRRSIIGIIDYGAGNCASVRSALSKLGYRTRLVNSQADFNGIDAIVLPGVGAFSTAMTALHDLQLVTLIRSWAYDGRPILGICLGMQMLAEASYEHTYTAGLELIPGKVVQLDNPKWHIGWNSLESHDNESNNHFLLDYIGSSFYFNHSFEFQAPSEYIVSITRMERPIVAIVRRDNICGIQFHPEKSQISGMKILKNTIKELLHA